LLPEYLSQNGLADDHPQSAVLRIHIEDLLRNYCSEVDGSTDSSKDLNNTSDPDTALISPSLEEGQENQDEIIQCNESRYQKIEVSSNG
jgi:hypothetical protein